MKIKKFRFSAIDHLKNRINITLQEAIKVPDLAKQMYKQLNNAFLSTGSENEYVAPMTYQNHHYSITGTYSEWKSFFGNQ